MGERRLVLPLGDDHTGLAQDLGFTRGQVVLQVLIVLATDCMSHEERTYGSASTTTRVQARER